MFSRSLLTLVKRHEYFMGSSHRCDACGRDFLATSDKCPHCGSMSMTSLQKDPTLSENVRKSGGKADG